MSEHDPARRTSKFEWRPEDVEILSDEEAALVRARAAKRHAKLDERGEESS